MSRRNYQVVVQGLNEAKPFHYKGSAIDHARIYVNQGRRVHIESKRTGQITYMLQKQQTSCTVCGNELEGKQHCPLCGRLHYYT